MKMIHRKIVSILNVSDFPQGFAFAEKMKMICKALVESGIEVNIINSSPSNYSKTKKTDLPASGVFDRINYYYTSGTPYYSSSVLKNIFLKLKGFIKEFSLLYSLSGKKRNHYVIISYCSVTKLIYYKILSLLFHFGLVISIMELHISFQYKNPIKRWNAKFFDRYAFGFADKVLPISKALAEHILKYYKKKEILIIPVLTDFSEYKKERNVCSKYLMYCGNSYQEEILEIILESYLLNEICDEINLKLVLHGSNVEKVRKKIDAFNITKSIQIFSDLKRDELIDLYIDSYALLIPMSETDRNIFRFPQKIAEYCASGRPIITTNVGEIPRYFTDNENAFISEKADVKSYSRKIRFVIDNPEIANRVGKKGKESGRDYFDYRVFSSKIFKFLFLE